MALDISKKDVDTEKLCKLVKKVVTNFFGDNLGWEYYNGKDAEKDIKRMLKLANKIMKQ